MPDSPPSPPAAVPYDLDPLSTSPPASATMTQSPFYPRPSPATSQLAFPAAAYSATVPSLTSQPATPSYATYLMPLQTTATTPESAATHQLVQLTQLLQLTNAAQLLQLGSSPGAGVAAQDTAAAAMQQQQRQLATAIAVQQQQQQQLATAIATQQQQQQLLQQQQQQQAATAAAAVPAPLTEAVLKLQPQQSLSSSISSTDTLRSAGCRQVKLLVSSGGTFQRHSATGFWSYVGGENRLAAVQLHASYQQLLADLSRASTHTVDAACSIKYELPGTPEQLVDLKTDDDVDNMWDEWVAHCELVRKPTFKLRLYVQAPARPCRTSSGGIPSPTRRSLEAPFNSASSASSAASEPPHAAGAPACPLTPSRVSFDDSPAHHSSDTSSTDLSTPLAPIAEATSASSSATEAATPTSATPPATTPPATPPPPEDPLVAASLALALPELALYEPPEVTVSDLLKLESKFELIPPDKIQITRALGEGVYGEVYMGTWMDVEVAVKCLNTAVFNPEGWQGPLGSISPAFFASLVEEANSLSSFRHPNIVWMYGVVLPSVGDVVAGALAAGVRASVSTVALPPAGPVLDVDAEAAAQQQPAPLTAVQLADATAGAVGTALPEGTVPPTAAATAGDGAVLAAADAGERATPLPCTSGLNGMELDECGVPRRVRPPAIVVEFMSGRSLRGCLVRGEEFLRNPMVRAKIALDAARGMAYLHSKRRPHLDLKSANIVCGFRDRQPIAKVADFGLIKYKICNFLAPSKLPFMKNTLPWVAPELLRGLPPAGLFAVDVYSFGVVLWELWTRQMPYTNLNNQQLLDARLANPELRPPVPGSFQWEAEAVPPEPGPGWSELMQECWADDPLARPGFSQVVNRLQAIMGALKVKKRNIVTV